MPPLNAGLIRGCLQLQGPATQEWGLGWILLFSLLWCHHFALSFFLSLFPSFFLSEQSSRRPSAALIEHYTGEGWWTLTYNSCHLQIAVDDQTRWSSQLHRSMTAAFDGGIKIPWLQVCLPPDRPERNTRPSSLPQNSGMLVLAHNLFHCGLSLVFLFVLHLACLTSVWTCRSGFCCRIMLLPLTAFFTLHPPTPRTCLLWHAIRSCKQLGPIAYPSRLCRMWW